MEGAGCKASTGYNLTLMHEHVAGEKSGRRHMKMLTESTPVDEIIDNFYFLLFPYLRFLIFLL